MNQKRPCSHEPQHVPWSAFNPTDTRDQTGNGSRMGPTVLKVTAQGNHWTGGGLRAVRQDTGAVPALYPCILITEKGCGKGLHAQSRDGGHRKGDLCCGMHADRTILHHILQDAEPSRWVSLATQS